PHRFDPPAAGTCEGIPMSAPHPDPAHRERRLDEAIASFLEAADAGRAPDREDLLRAHPDLADDLAAYFARHDRLERVIKPLRPSDPTEPATAAAIEATAEHRPRHAGPPGPSRAAPGTTLPAPSSLRDDAAEPGGGGRGDGGDGGDGGGAGDADDPDLPRGS